MARTKMLHYDHNVDYHAHLDQVVGKNYDLYSSEFTPETGTRTKWTKNFDNHSSYPWYEKGSIYGESGKSSELHIISNGAGGSNSNCTGDKREVIFLIGGGTSNYLSTQIEGLSFNWRCGATGSNRLGFWKWGYWLQLPGASGMGSKYRWGSADMAKERTTNQFENHYFPNDVLNKLNEGYVFKYLMFNISNHRNGSKPICETSRVFINSFKFKYRRFSQYSSKKLLIPKARSWSNAGQHNMF